MKSQKRENEKSPINVEIEKVEVEAWNYEWRIYENLRLEIYHSTTNCYSIDSSHFMSFDNSHFIINWFACDLKQKFLF